VAFNPCCHNDTASETAPIFHCCMVDEGGLFSLYSLTLSFVSIDTASITTSVCRWCMVD